MELLQGITINPGDVSLTVLIVWAVFQVVTRLLGNQRSESDGDKKIMLSLVENQTAATNRLANALEKNTESNNRVVVDAEKSRERTRQEQRDYQVAITGSLDSIAAANAQIFNKLDTDIGGITEQLARPDGVRAKLDIVIESIKDIREHIHEAKIKDIVPKLNALEAAVKLLQPKAEPTPPEAIEVKVDAAITLETPGESPAPNVAAEGNEVGT